MSTSTFDYLQKSWIPHTFSRCPRKWYYLLDSTLRISFRFHRRGRWFRPYCTNSPNQAERCLFAYHRGLRHADMRHHTTLFPALTGFEAIPGRL